LDGKQIRWLMLYKSMYINELQDDEINANVYNDVDRDKRTNLDLDDLFARTCVFRSTFDDKGITFDAGFKEDWDSDGGIVAMTEVNSDRVSNGDEEGNDDLDDENTTIQPRTSKEQTPKRSKQGRSTAKRRKQRRLRTGAFSSRNVTSNIRSNVPSNVPRVDY
ncbi:hypothetical protein KEM56_005257, partial [Ascosphaera pollenicola]